MISPIHTASALLGVSSLLGHLANALPTTEAVAHTAAQVCNGRSEYCSRSYSAVSFVGSHDSAFVGELPQQNQNIDVTAQLNMGVRFLQAQTHHSLINKDVLELCHTSCLLEDAGTLQSYLSTIKTFLDANANEVVTLLLTNGDSVDITDFGNAFAKSGIDRYAFVPASNPLPLGSWPTLGQMISSGKRLVVFLGSLYPTTSSYSLPSIKRLAKNSRPPWNSVLHQAVPNVAYVALDYGANTNKVNYILDEFAYYFETPYDVTDSNFSGCSIDRPSGASPSGRMYIVNHFLDVDIFGVKVPDRTAAGTTNAATGKGSIGAQASVCKGLYNRAPNVVLLDFVDKGNAIKAQDTLNGL
ncbi:PI-PLC X domain-containing protein 1 [Penicillium oxalicum]|uniref:PI-PLC X domain-containing protein 1 n=1 Tax=Penicillium oxalicum TaxID=69781 RepID=UPI0020B6CC9D|nr:PI-PLC X domain-containing protein 1 [Penicillium oxalicum]KAI2788988.1 PI-PLC X domain-containing protein 1 [Penicillium oxalicum]